MEVIKVVKKHFINNLVLQLNCISRISAMENAPRTQKLINMVIDSIRYRTGRENQIVRIKKELKYVEIFLETFKIRFGEMLKYTIDSEQSCLDIYIPHYTIMTFVENSMYYAFDDKEGPWEVGIIISKTDTGTKILISDNGTGFEPKTYIKYDDRNLSYGSISSTLSRFIQFSGGEDAVEIKSSYGNGTTVTINIPKFNKENV